MGIEVVFTDDPAFVLKVARAFLASQPVSHNLVLSLLDARTTHPEPGRYWLARENEEIVGVILQSPLTFDATLTPMDGRAVEAVVSALADAGISLPGIKETPRRQPASLGNGVNDGSPRPRRFRVAVSTNDWNWARLQTTKVGFGLLFQATGA